MFEKKVERKVNEFIARDGIKVRELQYSATIFYFSVMVVYDEFGGSN